MDYRQELESLLYELGSPYLLRRSLPLKCRCVSPVTDDADPSCKECGGTGQRFELVRVIALKQRGSQPQSYPFLTEQKDVGRMAIASHRWYLPHDVQVQTGDEIWEVVWQGDMPVEVVQVHRIGSPPNVLHEGNFRRVVVEVFTHTAPYRVQVARFMVKEQAGLRVYLPIFRGDAV